VWESRQVREKDKRVMVFGILWVTAAVTITVAFLSIAVFSVDW
jgi:hypothetical protein